MAYYRVKFANREVIVESDQPMSYVGEIYKDRLVGECDEHGNLRNPYITPELAKALAEFTGEFVQERPQYARDATTVEQLIPFEYELSPKRVDEFRQLLEPQKVLHPEECGIVQTHTRRLKDVLGDIPSMGHLWTDIKPLPEYYDSVKRELTLEGDVVETPITPEETTMSNLPIIAQILAKAVNTIPLRILSEFGADESVKYLFEKVTAQGFSNLQYAKWIMDHGNSTTLELLEALQTETPIPVKDADPITAEERARLVAYIGKINAALIEHGVDPHYKHPPEVWQSQNVFTAEPVSAFDIIKQNHPELTIEQFLTDCLGRGSVVMDDNDPNPLKLELDPEKALKLLRVFIINQLDTFKGNVDESYGYYEHLGEARLTLMDKQFKHLRRYAKQLVRRLTAPGDTADQVFIDTAESDQFGFLTRGIENKEWTRHFTIKFIDDNWLIAEH